MLNQITTARQACRNLSAIGLILTLICAAPAFAKKGPVGSLFQQDALLSFTLKYDISRLQKDKDSLRETGVAGKLTYEGREMDVLVMPRGQGSFLCQQPQLRIDFSNASSQGTPFEGFKKTKLFTSGRCIDNVTNNQIDLQILSNYLIYKLQERVLSPHFKTRLVSISYQDTSGQIAPYQQLAFFLESEQHAEARLNLKRIEDEALPPAIANELHKLEPAITSMVHAFEFFIGNLDYGIPGIFSPLLNMPSPMEKNIQIFRNPEGTIYPMAFDFDFSRFNYLPDATRCATSMSFYMEGELLTQCETADLTAIYRKDLERFPFKQDFAQNFLKLKQAFAEWQELNRDQIARLGPNYLAGLKASVDALELAIASTQ